MNARLHRPGPLVAGALTAAALAVMAPTASAHQAPSGWTYPLACCSNRDCTRIADDRVRITPDGYVVSLQPGDHDFVPEAAVTFPIPFDDAQHAPDGEYHICIDEQMNLLCFFAGAVGA